MTERIRLGVVGCGAVAQIQHLPNLAFLRDEFDVIAVCDLSATLARGAADEYRVDAWHTDLDAFLAEPLDAVLLCQSDPKVDVAMRVLQSGRHLFIEKPVAFVPGDVDRMAAAAQAAVTTTAAAEIEKRAANGRPLLCSIVCRRYSSENGTSESSTIVPPAYCQIPMYPVVTSPFAFQSRVVAAPS